MDDTNQTTPPADDTDVVEETPATDGAPAPMGDAPVTPMGGSDDAPVEPTMGGTEDAPAAPVAEGGEEAPAAPQGDVQSEDDDQAAA